MLLASCLECNPEKLSETSNHENTERWDSIAHLSLLGLLEDESPGLLDKKPALAEAKSLQEIMSILIGEQKS